MTEARLADHVTVFNDRDVARGDYVMYWCHASRRATDNLAVEHAVEWGDRLKLPVIVYESLDPRYPHANDRIHTFVLQGAVGMGAAFEARRIGYAFHLPRTADEARASRAVARLAERAAVVVTDAWPGPSGSLASRMAAFAATLRCRVDAVDDAVAVPVARLGSGTGGARSVRSRVLPLRDAALAPVADRTPRAPAPSIEWPFEPLAFETGAIATLVARCDIDHGVPAVESNHGGRSAAHDRLQRFIAGPLRHYATERNDLARIGTSALSAHLHFGHLSVRSVARAVLESHAPAESRDAFLEPLLVRRGLAFAHAHAHSNHDRYESLPTWARTTLAAHAPDRRAACAFEAWLAAQTPDPLWNAAQRELLRDGTIHPYARMLWGKVAITLAGSPRQAFEWLCTLNDRFALDGRDPSGHANIGWCFGLHDRPFPERPVFGKVRSMTSRATAAKWDVRDYLSRVGAPDDLSALERRPRKAPRATADEFDQRTPDDD